MKPLRHILLVLLAILVLAGRGYGCAFSDDDTPSPSDPDRPYADFVAGKLGIVTGDLRIRHLVVAYNTLSGRGLTPAERKAAIDVDRFYNYGAETEINPERKVPGSDYDSFANCLKDAYDRAAATLAARQASYAKPGQPDPPEIADWKAGQAAVFSNCKEKGQTPAPAPANAPQWLKQDRAYQIAAAHFYALEYDAALAGFRAIAADKASPWAQISRYIVARVLIRKAVVPYTADVNPAGEAAAAQLRAGLAAARDELQSILHDPAMAPLYPQAGHLLDYVMIRLDPAAQADELARRLTQPAKPVGDSTADPAFRQNLIDLTFAYNSLPAYSIPTPGAGGPRSPAPPAKTPLLRWIADFYDGGAPDIGVSLAQIQNSDPTARQRDLLTAWRATHQAPWLAAAISGAQPGGDGVAEMIAAARAIPQNSPAYATVTYNRLRLESSDPAAHYAEVAALMPEIERTQPRTTINAFADLRSVSTPNLDLFLKTATRITPQSIQTEPGEGFAAPPDGTGYNTLRSNVSLCGVPIDTPDTLHLDPTTAVIFNQRMPLSLLREASLSPDLPPNIRFSVAHMAWTRAILLDQPEIAHALSPYLAQCQPAFKPWLDQYDAAKTPDDRHVLGLLALMRFTSTNPVVASGSERDFAAYDETRANWWCDTNQPYEGSTEAPKTTSLFSEPLVPRGAATAVPRPNQHGSDSEAPAEPRPDPPFLNPADRAAVDREIAALEKIGDAGDFFARQALDWVKAHPTDPHNPDLLGFAMRVVRNACRSKDTKELNHQLFLTINARYPKSEWALRYKTWD